MSPVFHAFTFLARLAPSLAINAVIIAGFYRGGWSPGTVLALFWLETVIRIPLTAALAILHRRRTRKLGYYRLEKSPDDGKVRAKPSSYLAEFLMASIVFAAAHGLFLAIILFAMLKGRGAMDLADVKTGVSLLVVILVVTFVVDAAQLRSRPFAWMRHRTDTLMQRVIILHLAIIFGMFIAAMLTDEAVGFFGVFIALKVLVDPLAELSAWDPEKPPRWLVWLGERGRKGGGGEVTAEWVRARAARLEAERSLDEMGVTEAR